MCAFVYSMCVRETERLHENALPTVTHTHTQAHTNTHAHMHIHKYTTFTRPIYHCTHGPNEAIAQNYLHIN